MEMEALEKKGTSSTADKQGTSDADQAETEAVAAAEENLDEMVNAEIADLGSILDTVMGREWFQLFVQGQVDEDMVAKRWGTAALEIFEVNRAMVELTEEELREVQGNRAEKGEGSQDCEMDKGEERREEWRDMASDDGDAAPRGVPEGQEGSGLQVEDQLRVRDMSEEGSEASSGAKVFPAREVVAGNRREAGEAEGAVDSGGDGDHAENENEQQLLLDTQFDAPLENTGAEMDVLESSGMAAAGSSTGSSTEVAGNGSYGEGRVRTNREGWLL